MRQVKRAAFAALPAWLAVVLAVCFALPGWVDEIPPLVLALILCTIQPVRLARARSAWRGGKSHRARDLRAAAAFSGARGAGQSSPLLPSATGGPVIEGRPGPRGDSQ